jgi:hypothetical protein
VYHVATDVEFHTLEKQAHGPRKRKRKFSSEVMSDLALNTAKIY